MIFVKSIFKEPTVRNQVESCCRKCAFAITRGQRELARAHKYAILQYCLKDPCGIDKAIDDPVFDYWILRIGYLCKTGCDYTLNHNLRLFEAWLFVTVNK